MISSQHPLTSDTFPLLQCDPQSLADRKWTPAQDLQAAVLYQNWNDLRVFGYPYSRRSRRLVQESLEWVDNNDTGWPFASVAICHSLGFDIHAVRAAFRAVVAQRDANSAQPESAHITLANKLIEQVGQPEVFMYSSKKEAVRKRMTLTMNIPRILDDPLKYTFHTRVVESQVTCWIEEASLKRCCRCESVAVPTRSVCRPHLNEEVARAKRLKKENAERGEYTYQQEGGILL